MDFPTPKTWIALAKAQEGKVNFPLGKLQLILALVAFPLKKISLLFLCLFFWRLIFIDLMGEKNNATL